MTNFSLINNAPAYSLKTAWDFTCIEHDSYQKLSSIIETVECDRFKTENLKEKTFFLGSEEVLITSASQETDCELWRGLKFAQAGLQKLHQVNSTL